MLADRLGLPRVKGSGRLLVALAIDALGNGIYAPFVLLFLIQWTGLDLLTVGAALTAARLAALPLGAVAGPLTDRIGPQRTLVISGIAQAAGLAGYLISSQIWHVAVFSLLAATGDAAFWVASRSMMAEVVTETDRPRWLSAQIALRNGSFALGGLTAAAVLAAPDPRAMLFVVAANAVSFLVLAVLIATWRPARLPREADSRVKPSFAMVARDRAYLLYTFINLLLVFCMTAPSLLLAVYVGEVLHGPMWMVGLVFTMETILIAVCQTVAGRLIERHRRTRVLRWAAVAFAASAAVLAVLPTVPAALIVPGVLLAAIIGTVANLLEGPTGIGIATDAAPDDGRGRYTAVYQLSWNVGKAITPAAATWLLARGAALPWLALIACCALAFALLTPLSRALSPRANLA